MKLVFFVCVSLTLLYFCKRNGFIKKGPFFSLSELLSVGSTTQIRFCSNKKAAKSLTEYIK